MSIIPTNLKIKTFSEKDSRKYIEFQCIGGGIFTLSLAGYSTNILQDHFNSPVFVGNFSKKGRTHPLEWGNVFDYRQTVHKLLNVYAITKQIANYCVEGYIEDRYVNTNRHTPQKLINNRAEYYNLWAAKVVSPALKEVIESFNLNPEYLQIYKKAFSVLGPSYRLQIADIIRLKTREKKKFEPVFQNIMNSELSKFLIYTFSVLPFSTQAADLNIKNIITHYVNSRTDNLRVTEYCIKNIPTSLPIGCIVDYGHNLGMLEEPIFGRIEYKYFLANSYVGVTDKLILNKQDIKYLTNMFFDGKITFPNILRLRRAVDSIKAKSVDELALKLKHKQAEEGLFY